jgi:hypothetical protein
MTRDDLNRLETTLRDKAAEVAYAQSAPPSMLARARRRIARNAALSVVAVVVVLGGTSAGIASLRGPDVAVPASPTSPVLASCAAADVRVTPVLDGAAGSIEGEIDLRNAGAATCTLRGRPTVALIGPDGPLSVDVTDVPAQWQVDGAASPAGWPVVTLGPGETAAIRVRWSNQCPQIQGEVTWRIGLGPGGAPTSEASDRVPPCLGSAEPPLLEAGPFEPAARS